MGFEPMDIIDIGGGFSDNPTNYFADGTSNQHNRFSVIAPQVNHYLENVFPGKHKNVKLIGEPGRQISQEAGNLVAQVFMKKDHGDVNHYYINAGIYQGFGSIPID